MKQFSKDLGNVSIVPKGKWSREQEYERLALVYNACDNLSYVSKIDVPSGVDIENREYWQPMNATGYADNNFINLTAENENGTITAYESLEEAVATILPINRRAGATLSFYNLNSDRLDRQAEFELWQFNSTDLANWENGDYWNNIYYNWNVFAGWYVGADGLKNHVKIPNVGQYAYVGTNLNDALLYQCRTNGVWTNTGIKVRNYISVVVSGNITIGENGNWFSNGEDTGIPATPAVDEQLDNIIIQLQQHATEIDKLQKQDVVLKSNIDSNFETINNKVDNIKTATDNKIDIADANLQNQITSNDNDIATLNTKHESLSRTVQGIAATGGASTATNVTYNNDSSGLNAENAQDAIDEVSSIVTYDVSAHNNGAVFESLQALLNSSNLNILIPISFRRGGMTIRFIQGSEQSSDNKYVQYRLTSDSFNTTEANWQGVDDEPTTGSDNLVKSGGVYEGINKKSALYPLYTFNVYGNYNSFLNIPSTRTAIILGNAKVDIFRAVPIDAVSVYLSQNTIFTLYKCIGVDTQNYSETLIQSFEGKAGWNIFYLTEPLSLEDNESIGTRCKSVGFYDNNDAGAGFRFANITIDGETTTYSWTSSSTNIIPLIPLTKFGGVFLNLIKKNVIDIEQNKKDVSLLLQNKTALLPLYTFNITSEILQEITPTNNRSALYLNRDKITNLNKTYIYGISAYLYSGSSIKVYKSTLDASNFSEELVKEFTDCVVGWNTLTFDEPLLLAENETIGVRSPLGFIATRDTGIELVDNLNTTPTHVVFAENSILLFPLVKAGGIIADLATQNTQNIEELCKKTALYPLYAFNVSGNYNPFVNIPSTRTAITLGNETVDIFRGAPINAVSVYLSTHSTFTLYKCINVGTQNYSEELILKEVGEQGWNLFYLNEPITLADNETIGTRCKEVGFYDNNDSRAGFRFANITTDRETKIYSWTSVNTNIMPLIPLTKFGGVFSKKIRDNEQAISSIVRHKFYGKKLSVMGDSISTYGGVQPSGNDVYYPAGDVNAYSKTWSGLLIEKTGMILDTLQTWSGSKVTGSKAAGSSAFVSSYRWRDNLGNPDVIIIYGGTNDIWSNSVDKGEIPDVYNYVSEVTPADYVEDTFDVTKFAPAYLYLLMKLKRTYPNAIIYACATTDFNRVNNEYWLNKCRLSKQIARDIIKQCADIVGCRFIDLAKCGINYYNNAQYAVDANLGGLHPNYAGMQLIANYIYEKL